jgi:hypothetical protein
MSDHAIWWVPMVALLPANILLPNADFGTRILFSLVVISLVEALLFLGVRRDKLRRLATDIEELGIIECLIRFPHAVPGSLRDRWAPGSAQLKPNIIVFREGNVIEPFGLDHVIGAPRVLKVQSFPEHRVLPPQRRNELRRNRRVVSIQTSDGEVELAADQMSLESLERLVYGNEL